MLAASLAVLIASAVTIAPDDARVVRIGHVASAAADAVVLSWSASELRFRARGNNIALDCDSTGADRVTVYVDDIARDVAIAAGGSRAVLASGLADSEHVVRVVKRTEPSAGVITVRAIVIDGAAADLASPPSPKSRSIEVLGDSLAAGFGVRGKGPECAPGAARADVDDAELGFAAVAAAQLGADVSIVAWSGRGIYRDFSGDESVETVPAMFARTSASAPLARAPDAVVVALGNNDFNRGLPDRAKFMAGYHALLDRVRTAYPRAYILLAAPMPLPGALHDVVKEQGPLWLNAIVHKRGDARMSFIALPDRDDKLGSGCLWHPGPAMQKRLADAVATELRARLAW